MTALEAKTPLAIEQRQRRADRRAFLVRRYGLRTLAVLASAALVLLLCWLIEGVGFGELLRRIVGRGARIEETDAGETLVGGPLSLGGVALVAGWVGTWLTVGGVWLLRAVLRAPGTTMTLARVTVDEALRTKVVAFVAILLIVVLATLPLWSTDDSPLRYRVQTYLGYSLFAMTALLTVVTCLYGCYTSARDLEEQRAHELFSKPVARGRYLLGKWIGVAGLDAVLVVAGATMVAYVADVQLGSLGSVVERSTDAYDRGAVGEQVLVARGTAEPRPPEPFVERAEAALQRLAEADPAAYNELLDSRGGEANALAEEVLRQQAAWLRIPPGLAQQYTFTGLGGVEATGQRTVQLRYRPKVANLDRGTGITLALQVAGEVTDLSTSVDQTLVFPIPVRFIDESGDLELILGNRDTGQSRRPVQFEPGDLQVLYVVGGFTGNLARAAALMWVRLAFLGMFAVVAGALMSMPVAMTVTGFAALIATFGASLAGLLSSTRNLTGSQVVDAGYSAVVEVVILLTRLLSSYGEVGLGALLADGRWVRGVDVLRTGGIVGLVWVGIVFVVGWALLSRREIARVQV